MEKGDQHSEEYEPTILEGRHIVMTPSGITFLLNEADQKQARRCLERSGKITLNFGEIAVSSLNEIRRIGQFGSPDGGTGPAPGPGPID